MYDWVKVIHVTCMALSFSLFVGRVFWILTGPGGVPYAWFRVVPHIVDTLLLLSGLTLAVLIRQYPFVNSDWLTVKVLALIGYIALGMLCLHGTRPRPARLMAAAVAVVVFAYIVSVAMSKRPSGFLAVFA